MKKVKVKITKKSKLSPYPFWMDEDFDLSIKRHVLRTMLLQLADHLFIKRDKEKAKEVFEQLQDWI